jgi:two-component system KDP operon response regulator KdpE
LEAIVKMENITERILIVEDDRQISGFIQHSLKAEGFLCVTAETGRQAMSRLSSGPIDILLLDLGLPDMDGLDIIGHVRQSSEMPIIIISARDRDTEKATALDFGADDYLTKPFSATELAARLRVAVRRLRKAGDSASQQARAVGGLQIDFDKRRVELDGEELRTTRLEYKLIALCFKNIGKVLTTDYILTEVWGEGYDDTQILRTLMAQVRRKIEKSPANPRYIITEPGVGYRLVDE